MRAGTSDGGNEAFGTRYTFQHLIIARRLIIFLLLSVDNQPRFLRGNCGKERAGNERTSFLPFLSRSRVFRSLSLSVSLASACIAGTVSR